LDRSTIRKYQKITKEEFHNWIREERIFVKDLLTQKPYLSAAQIEDRLKENYLDFPTIHSKTVYNFVLGIRKQYDLPKPKKTTERVFEKLPEVDFLGKPGYRPKKRAERKFTFLQWCCPAHDISLSYLGQNPLQQRPHPKPITWHLPGLKEYREK